MFFFTGIGLMRSRAIIAAMKSRATKLRKNDFWNAGRSPASLTNSVITEKPNAAVRI